MLSWAMRRGAMTAMIGCLLAIAAALVVVGTGTPARAATPGASPSAGWLPETPPDWPLVTAEQTSAPQTLTRGITHSTDVLQTVAGRQSGQVLHVDLSDPNVRAGVVDAGDHIVDENDETLSSMAARTGAVAGVNGDFFEWQDDGDPVDMVVQDGQLWKSPNPGGHLSDFLLLDNGSAVVTSETFSGTLTVGSATHPLASVNTLDPQIADGISLVTPQEGPIAGLPASEVAVGHLVDGGSTLAIDGVTSGVTSLPALAPGEEDLVGVGSGGAWIASTIHSGDIVSVADSLSPYPLSQIRNALSGGAILVHDGQMAVPVTGSGENNENLGVTGVGVSADGRQLVVAVFDGEQPESQAEGLTRPQMAQWMIEHGAHNAILFDTGGSAEMVGRLPGQTRASVLNTPSDGHERPLADGLFFYSTESTPGAAAAVTVNDGAPLTLLAGTSVPVSSHATDARANPAAQSPTLAVADPALATVHGDAVTAGSAAGQTSLTATAGRATASVPLRVVTRLAGLAISPSQPDVDDGATQQLSIAGTAADGARVSIAPADVTWSAAPSTLGSVSRTGLFTAAAGGVGMVTVTASAGGARATTTVAVGQTSRVIDPLTDAARWSVEPDDGAIGTVTDSSQSPGPFAHGSLTLRFTYPQGFGFKQFYLTPTSTETITALDGRTPDEIGIWIKGDGEDPVFHTPLSHGNLSFGVSVTQANGQSLTFWPSTITYGGWRLLTARLPAGTQLPLTMSFLCFIDELPPRTTTGSVSFSDLEALYSPRPGAAPTRWRPVADNPSWLSYTPDPRTFAPGGTTIATAADAQLTASAPAAPALQHLSSELAGLPRRAGPSTLLTLGNMSASGSLADLEATRSALGAVGLPWRTAVGEGETSDGADPENVNDASVFGPTHTATRVGDADMIVLDDSAGGVLASDPDQSPAQEQYAWLVSQLDADSAPVTIVAMSLPVSDPNASAADQFTDSDEAEQFQTLLARFQATHPRTHVLVLTGQRSGYWQQLLGADGSDGPGGVPTFDVGDLSLAPTAPADAGGFLDAGLFHVDGDGRVQYAVAPLLRAISIDAARSRLHPGQRLALRATGTELATDAGSAPTVAITDPLARRWSSSRPWVASVDPATGEVVAHRRGATRITIDSGGASATSVIAVRR